jgi:hypothetical protein
MAMGVHINGANALSVDDDLPSPLRSLRQSGPHQTASEKSKAGQRTTSMAEYFSSACHHLHFPH